MKKPGMSSRGFSQGQAGECTTAKEQIAPGVQMTTVGAL